MKRYFTILLALSVVLLCCIGCGEKGVDPSIKPQTIFSQYAELTELYGTERMATLEALGIDLQEVENISDNVWGIPRTETYADLDFKISALFQGKDNHFAGVYMERVYQFPEEEDALILDAVKVCRQLNEDFGVATDNSYFFNWVSVMMGEEWNRDIKFWQDPFVIKRVVDENFGGTLLAWDLTPTASPAIKKELELHDGDAKHGLACSLHIYENEGKAVLSVAY